MRLRRQVMVVLSVALVAAGCSAPEPSPPDAPEAAASPTARESKPGATPKDGKPRPGGKRRSRERSGKKGDGGGSPFAGTGEGRRENDAGSVAFPAPGDYVYKQNGFERFCQSGACDRRDLPNVQRVATSVERRGDDEAVVVSEAQVSERRFSRTTVRFTRDAAFITKVYARFGYGAFNFENTYRPDPPVESLRFPLRAGMKWSGSWKDDVSGTYRIEVSRRMTIAVAGRAVETFRLATQTSFRGDFSGQATVTLWVDPETRAVVRTDGRMSLRSSFGSYDTEFLTVLRSGPGYR